MTSSKYITPQLRLLEPEEKEKTTPPPIPPLYFFYFFKNYLATVLLAQPAGGREFGWGKSGRGAEIINSDEAV